MVNKLKNYDDDSIQVYAPLEAIRKKVDLYIGRSDNGATALVVKEIVANSIDEYFAGHGNKIDIKINTKENSISVRDYGRGIPTGKIDSCFTELHSSGKFEKKEGSSYGASSGTHGIGIKAVSALGETQAEIYRDGIKYSNTYTWQSIGKLAETQTKEKNGTYVKWTPDPEPFHGDNKLNYNNIKEMLEDLSYITAGMEFSLACDDKKPEIISSVGIKDYMSDYLTEKDLISPYFDFSYLDDYMLVEGILVWTKTKQLERSYINAVLTTGGGTHITALRSTLTREVNRFLGSDLKGEEIRRNLSFILNIKTIEELSFSSQSKDTLSTPALSTPLNKILKEQIGFILETNKAFFQALEKSIYLDRKKVNTQAIMRDLTNRKPAGVLKELSEKYKGCSNSSGIELFLTEGDSAAGGLHLTKSHTNQAVFSLRGKPLNTFSQNLEKVLKNKEIKELIGILGRENEALKKFDKIILAADAD